MRSRTAQTLAAALSLLAAVVAASPVPAQAVTFDFPTSTTTIETPGGGVGDADQTGFFHRAGVVDPAFMQETFSTGLAQVGSLDLHLVVATNVLSSGATVDFDVILNGVPIGDFSVNEAFGEGPLDLSFSFAPIAGQGVGGDDFTLLLNMTNNVPIGAGSIAFGKSPTHDTTVVFEPGAAVPAPAALVLLGLGLVTAGIVRRRT